VGWDPQTQYYNTTDPSRHKVYNRSTRTYIKLFKNNGENHKMIKKEKPKTQTKKQAILRDVGRYHELTWGGGQVTISKELKKNLPWENKDKIFVEYDEAADELRISRLNP